MICAPATSSGPSAGTSARREREARCAADGLEHREVEARLLREGARRDLPVGAERALGGQQRQPALGDGRAQLLDPGAVLVQRLQQREPRRARVLVEAVEQSERREVRLGHAGTARRHGRDRDRDAVQDRVAADRVDEALVGEDVGVDARVRGRHAEPRAGRVVAPAVRERDHAGHDGVGHLDGRLERAGAVLDPRRAAVGEPEPLRVVGVDLQRAALRPADEQLEVVHPRVVRAQLAAPDEHEPAVRRADERGAQPRDVGDDRLGRELDPAARGAQRVRQPRLERAEVDAVRRRLEVGEREVVGPGAQQQVEQPLRAAPRLDLGEQRVGVAPVQRGVLVGGLAPDQLGRHEAVERLDVGGRRLPGGDRGEPQQRHPLVGHRGPSTTGGEKFATLRTASW